VAKHADVLVIGAGPAGIATAIAASLKGLRASVLDYSPLLLQAYRTWEFI
jgi:thioredoxin reductase